MFRSVDFEVIRVIDGDTIVVNVYLGINVWLLDQHIRIFGINAPEIRGESKEEGLKSKERVVELMRDAKFLELTDHRDKYGRLLGDFILDGDKRLSETLVSEGLAIYQQY